MSEVAVSENDAKSSTNLPLTFDKELREKIKGSKVLVVGAGGIGCELLKNLVLTGFEDIEIIDLDTIDVSNLNRQFLFHKKHVGMSKAKVARDSVLQFNPKAKIVSHHSSVMSSEFNVSYFGRFSLVLNALDNRQARSHVNRLCLAARVPLIESGTSGYSGQVELISKGLTACYDCSPKPTQKTFPSCTIRNTPSQLIHCIVWAKHLFNQLFGEVDPTNEDEEVSPDPNDSEASRTESKKDGGSGDAGQDSSTTEKSNDESPSSSNSAAPAPRVQTRTWAQEMDYDGAALFKKFFSDDIKTLLSMADLWEKRRPPTLLPLEDALKQDTLSEGDVNSTESTTPLMKDQKLWTIAECANIFLECIKGLKKALDQSEHGYLVWDKDDKCAMEFVAATANIRAYIFGIKQNSLFEIKSMAGNIIPAIATSNAVIAGLIVLSAANVLRGELKQCASVYLREQPGHRGFLIPRETQLVAPSPDCTSCSAKPFVVVSTDISKTKIKDFDSHFLKENLNMIEPEVILTRTGNMILSSEEGEADDLKERTLEDLGVTDGCMLEADDFLQNFKISIVVVHREILRDDPQFTVIGKQGDFKPKEEKHENGSSEAVTGAIEDSSKPGPSTSNKAGEESEDEDCLMILDEEEGGPEEGGEPLRKRKVEETPVPVKKRKTEHQPPNEDDIITL